MCAGGCFGAQTKTSNVATMNASRHAVHRLHVSALLWFVRATGFPISLVIGSTKKKALHRLFASSPRRAGWAVPSLRVSPQTAATRSRSGLHRREACTATRISDSFFTKEESLHRGVEGCATTHAPLEPLCEAVPWSALLLRTLPGVQELGTAEWLQVHRACAHHGLHIAHSCGGAQGSSVLPWGGLQPLWRMWWWPLEIHPRQIEP